MMEKDKLKRAHSLKSAYNQTDRKYKLGKGNLTAKWIVKNIFTKPCHYCGETDWKKLGCNRIDNDLPHTTDNVEPCCMKCNRKLPRNRTFKDLINQEVLLETHRYFNVYPSISDAIRMICSY